MRAKLLKKHRKGKFIEYNKKTKRYRFRHGYHLVDGSNDAAWHTDTGWNKNLEYIRSVVRRCVLEDAELDFKTTWFRYERPYIEFIK